MNKGCVCETLIGIHKICNVFSLIDLIFYSLPYKNKLNSKWRLWARVSQYWEKVRMFNFWYHQFNLKYIANHRVTKSLMRWVFFLHGWLVSGQTILRSSFSFRKGRSGPYFMVYPWTPLSIPRARHALLLYTKRVATPKTACRAGGLWLSYYSLGCPMPYVPVTD
jgi:hypothetical protein